ncbi:MAG: hypothetical protein FWH25_03560 [Syntrophorhabdaceae bacterium]|nr:hypothetical protein [Syntrophorhabdaceae bacterium]
MELVSKIFETLEISRLALVQFGVVIFLAFLLTILLIRPLLRLFAERDNLTMKPLKEARSLLDEADEKSHRYDEELLKTGHEALARKRAAAEEVSRSERRRIEAAAEESNKKLEEIKRGIRAEKEAVAASLKSEVAQLSMRIAEKVLGREVA